MLCSLKELYYTKFQKVEKPLSCWLRNYGTRLISELSVSEVTLAELVFRLPSGLK